MADESGNLGKSGDSGNSIDSGHSGKSIDSSGSGEYGGLNLMILVILVVTECDVPIPGITGTKFGTRAD